MTKLALVPAVGLAMMLALLVGACRPTPRESPQANTLQACNAIHDAINGASLDSHDSETVIKLAAAHDGVPETIRNAIDAYYRGDHAAGRQAMLKACADAGYPAS